MDSNLERYVQLIKDYILSESENNIESFQFENISPLKYLSKEEQIKKLNIIINKFYDILNTGYPFVAYNFENNIFNEDDFFKTIPSVLIATEEKINIENLESNKEIEGFKTEYVRAKYLEMALKKRDLILNLKTEQTNLLNSTKSESEITTYDYLFETNTQNAYSIAEKYNLSEYDRDYIRHNFWPIIKLNSYDLKNIKEKLKTLRVEFIKKHTVFNLEIFNRENTSFLSYEINQYIDVLKRGKVETWDEYGNEIFHIFKMESDTKDNTLIISDKNITQLEIYFKNIINIIQEFINPETINLQNSTKTEHGIIKDFEKSKGISQTEVRRGIRTHIKINYELSLKEFLQTNHLADEIFYINYIDKNQKERLHELEKEVSFFDISEGEKVTDNIADQWYNEKITRDHYWYYKEYQSFLNERLQVLNQSQQPEPKPLDFSDTSTIGKSQKQKPQGKTLQEFFKDGTPLDTIKSLQNKYKDLNGKKMAFLIYLLHNEFKLISYSLRGTKDSRKRFVNEFTGKNINNIEGINKIFNPNDITLGINKYHKDNDYTTIQNEIQTILNPIK